MEDDGKNESAPNLDARMEDVDEDAAAETNERRKILKISKRNLPIYYNVNPVCRKISPILILSVNSRNIRISLSGCLCPTTKPFCTSGHQRLRSHW
jgi:hypothetical protein